MSDRNFPDNCPACNASLIGAPIPEENRHLHAPGSTHYYRVIGLYDRKKDRTTHWKCPDCGHTWERK